MPDTVTTATSYTVLSGASLLQSKPDGDPFADWTPAQLVNNAVVPAAAGSRLFVKKNDQPGFTGDGQVGSRKLRIAFGGASTDDDHNTILLQCKAPDFDPDNINGTIPTIDVSVGAETQENPTNDEAAIVAALANAPVAAMISQFDAEGNLTIAVRLTGDERAEHADIVVTLDFGYSASN